MNELPLGTVPPIEDFLARVHGAYEITLPDEDSVYLVTGAINQGLDSSMVSVGATGTWIPGHGLSLVIHDGRSLYSLICRLIEIEIAHPNEFDPSPAALAHDILNHFGYGWAVPETTVTAEVGDGESESGEGSFQEVEG